MLARFWLECPLMKIPDEASIWLPGTVRSWNRFFGLSRPHRPGDRDAVRSGVSMPARRRQRHVGPFLRRHRGLRTGWEPETFSIGACFHILA
jgi:hypothetical protein